MKADGDKAKLPKAVATGTLWNGLVDCYVLDNGLRVLSQVGATAALSGSSAVSLNKDAYFWRILERLPSEYSNLQAWTRIDFSSPTGPAIGITAEHFVEVLRAYADADDAGALHHKQVHLAKNANRILRGLATIGITALIDEATGYQQVRQNNELQEKFDRLFAKTPAPWEQMFSPSLVTALCELDGYRWDGGVHPRHLASTNAKIYTMVIGSVAFAELRKRNPEVFHNNHHQLFTGEARDAFRQQLLIVEVLAKQSRDKDDFWRRMERQYGSGILQLTIAQSEVMA